MVRLWIKPNTVMYAAQCAIVLLMSLQLQVYSCALAADRRKNTNRSFPFAKNQLKN